MAEVTVYCPRCDRPKVRETEKLALEALSIHVDKAHPDMLNYIKEEITNANS